MADKPGRDEIPPGTLYMLILKVLARSDPKHGYEIASAIQQVSSDVLLEQPGSVDLIGRELREIEIAPEHDTTRGLRVQIAARKPAHRRTTDRARDHELREAPRRRRFDRRCNVGG